MGQMMASKYIAGVALGGLVFSYIYISLNFLRMSTTGLVAQNKGSQEYTKLEKGLLRYNKFPYETLSRYKYLLY